MVAALRSRHEAANLQLLWIGCNKNCVLTAYVLIVAYYVRVSKLKQPDFSIQWNIP
jgi:hypothetical protein